MLAVHRYGHVGNGSRGIVWTLDVLITFAGRDLARGDDAVAAAMYGHSIPV